MMAFTITPRGTRFRLSTGDGRPAEAKNVEEIIEAIRHYWGEPYHRNKRQSCPFCRQA
jgi:hypothetical protein